MTIAPHLRTEKLEAIESSQPIRKILVAVDGSESADNALSIATRIAEKCSAAIDLIHVSDSHVSQSIGTRTSSKSTFSDGSMLLERTKTLVAKGLKTKPIYSFSSPGSVCDEILKAAETGDYDLLVLGSRGLGRTRGFFLGSVSKKVVAEAKCSVLVSKARINNIARVLLAYDGSEGSRKTLAVVSDMAKKFNSVVDVVSAISEPMISAELNVRAAVERLDDEMQYHSNQAALSLRELGVNSESAKVVGARKISIAIVQEAEKGKYDIVALGNRGWGKTKSMLLGSIASSVLDTCEANLLIVK